MGSTGADEMCNFYIMYYYTGVREDPARGIECWSGSETDLAEIYGRENLPEETSSFEGKYYEGRVYKRFGY